MHAEKKLHQTLENPIVDSVIVIGEIIPSECKYTFLHNGKHIVSPEEARFQVAEGEYTSYPLDKFDIPAHQPDNIFVLQTPPGTLTIDRIECHPSNSQYFSIDMNIDVSVSQGAGIIYFGKIDMNIKKKRDFVESFIAGFANMGMRIPVDYNIEITDNLNSLMERYTILNNQQISIKLAKNEAL